jgi:hypothetical protein
MASVLKKRGAVRQADTGGVSGKIPAPAKGVSGRFRDALAIAQQTGLLRGARTKIVRGRMPNALVQKAKASSGVQSDTELIEVALANLAVADEYPAWLLSQRGTISKDADLEF